MLEKMSARPKTQESFLNSKSAVQPQDLRIRSTSNSTPPKQSDKTVAEISMKDFLDFLKISYQVNEAIDRVSSDNSEKVSIDWKKLTSETLINRLKEREAALSKEKAEKNKLESTEEPQIINEEKISRDVSLNGSESSNKGATCENSDEILPENKFLEQSETHLSIRKISSSHSLDRRVVSEKVKRSNLGRKKNNSFKKENSAESENFGTSVDDAEGDRAPAKILKKKLNEVLQEGILDSVLPYLIPKQQQLQDNNPSIVKKLQPFNDLKKTAVGNLDKSEKLSGNFFKEKLELKKKSFLKNDSSLKNDKKDIEVIIHVCDEIKNLKRDFKCPQKLLVSQMGYFAEVTSGQKLEDMDISVHCDVTIFDWLMRWVQKDNLSREHWPALDSSIVIPVLMSSAFLQMNSLQEHCLRYCKTHINDIIRDSPNLSCINDNVLTRLANLFSNTEIENIIDKKDKIQSKLFCKLIAALTEPEPQPERGHFSSVATIYRCSKCIKIILRSMSGSILCVPSNVAMDRNGFIHSTHVYDSSWNLTDYVKNLKAELKTWRRVYWRLWADCHLLFCHACEEHFPVHHMSWCRFHLESVQYFPVENQGSVTYPVGRYSCCGEKAYRFEVLKKVSGCQYRDHITNPKNARDVEVFRIWNTHKELIKEDPPCTLVQEKVKFIKQSKEEAVKRSPVKENYWWEGLEIVPSKSSSGLLTKLWDTVMKKDESKIAGNLEHKYQKLPFAKSATNSQASVQDNSSYSESSDESCISSNAANSEESFHSTTKVVSKAKNFLPSHHPTSTRLSYVRKEKKKQKKKKKKNLAVKSNGNRFWLTKLSTRCNQDNQREFEERALRQIESILTKKVSGETFRTTGTRNSYQVVPSGGIYVKLEQEWREAHCFSHGCPGSSIKARGSASYVNVNSSTYSLHKRSKSRGHR